jgi:hypothetical protein
MTPSHRLHLACASLAVALTVTTAQAGTFGLSADPMALGWDRGDLNSGFAVWDTFPFVNGPMGPAATFTDATPNSGSGLTSPLLDQTTSGPLWTGGGDRIYSFGSSPVWTITASSLFTVKGFVLQMKQYQDPGVALSLLYAPTLNGIVADYVSTTTFTEGDNTNSVTTWWWGASLASQSFTDVTLQIADQSANHYSVDAISIDAGTVSVVPEPTMIPLLGGAGLFFLMRRRRGAATLTA